MSRDENQIKENKTEKKEKDNLIPEECYNIFFSTRYYTV